jgi:hypothetical protein
VGRGPPRCPQGPSPRGGEAIAPDPTRQRATAASPRGDGDHSRYGKAAVSQPARPPSRVSTSARGGAAPKSHNRPPLASVPNAPRKQRSRPLASHDVEERLGHVGAEGEDVVPHRRPHGPVNWHSGTACCRETGRDRMPVLAIEAGGVRRGTATRKGHAGTPAWQLTVNVGKPSRWHDHDRVGSGVFGQRRPSGRLAWRGSHDLGPVTGRPFPARRVAAPHGLPHLRRDFL